jgi:hypothetical protein
MGQELFSFINNKIGGYNLNFVGAAPQTSPRFLYFVSKCNVPSTIFTTNMPIQGEKDGWYKEDGWKGMLRMKLREKCIRLGKQGKNFDRVLLPLV